MHTKTIETNFVEMKIDAHRVFIVNTPYATCLRFCCTVLFILDIFQEFFLDVIHVIVAFGH